jgi:superfamily I DNA and RNA helicase
MKKQIENILQELYGSDSELKNREEELIQIIDSMINLKPNVKIDENFKEELRQKIVKEISVKKIQNFNENKNKPSIFQIFSYVF